MRDSLPVLLSDSALQRYLEEISKYPMLSEQEELQLAIAWYKDQDILAAQKLATSHLRLVAKMAKQYKGYGLPMVDLISEGNIGLMIAVKKFDPYKGNRLSTYAMLWIKAMIQEYILKSWSMVKMGTSSAHKKLFFNLRKIKNRILQANNGQIPYNENALIAKALDVSEEDARAMNERFAHYDTSLNDHNYDDGVEMIDLVPDNKPSQEYIMLEKNQSEYRKKIFAQAFSTLSEREQEVIKARKLKEDPETLQTLSVQLGISIERVRQIEVQALNKLAKACKDYIE